MEFQRTEESMVSRSRAQRKTLKMTPHYHSVHELYYLLEGKTQYFIDDEIFSVEKGDFVFIPSGSIHGTDYEMGKDSERLLVCFGDSYFEGEAEQLREKLMPLRVINIPKEYLAELEELLIKIEEEYRGQEIGRDLLLELYVKELLTLICRYHQERKTHIQEADRIIYEIAEYIRMNFAENISLVSLSKIFAVSQSYLSRKFKAVTGMGLNQFVTMVRINKSAQLLQESQLTVMEIAHRCGYNDSNYFAAVFKSVKGVTPLSFRKHRTLHHRRDNRQ